MHHVNVVTVPAALALDSSDLLTPTPHGGSTSLVIDPNGLVPAVMDPALSGSLSGGGNLGRSVQSISGLAHEVLSVGASTVGPGHPAW